MGGVPEKKGKEESFEKCELRGVNRSHILKRDRCINYNPWVGSQPPDDRAMELPIQKPWPGRPLTIVILSSSGAGDRG